jgi:hypothetical protein
MRPLLWKTQMASFTGNASARLQLLESWTFSMKDALGSLGIFYW